MGVANIIFTAIGMAVADKLGRRPLVIGGSFIMTVSLAVIITGDLTDVTALVIVAIMVFLFGYNTTLGPIKWACYVELMDAFGVSVAASLIFLMAFVIGLVFPLLVEVMNLYGAFSIFLGLSVYCLFFMIKEMKETKGKTTP